MALGSVSVGTVAAAGQSAFTPTSIPDIVSWWDAEQTDNITLNGSDVATWGDSYGSNDVTQATPSKQPAFNSGWRNSRPAVTFAGSEILELASFSGGAEAQPFTIAIVCEWFGSGTEYLIGDQDNLNNLQSNGAGSWIYNGALLEVTSDAPAHGTPTVFIWTSDSTSTSYEFHPHGDSATSGTGDSGTEGWNGMSIGGRHNETGLVTANIAEIIFYGAAVSSPNKATLAAHLKSKYAIVPS